MSTPEKNLEVARRWARDVLNGHNVASVDEILTPTHIIHDHSSPDLEMHNKEGMKGIRRRFREIAYPDAVLTTEEMYAAGDRVVHRFTFRGTHTGMLWNIAPTGKRIEIPHVSLYRFENGQIAETWAWWDSLGMMQQIGILPKTEDLRNPNA